MNGQIYLNGRFLTQPITGIQRFATEMMSAMDRLVQAKSFPATQILSPTKAVPGNRPEFRLHMPWRQVGRLSGHAWEQFELPARARHGVLVNLGNSAPVLSGGSQVVVIHDAGVFDTPETYTRKFRLYYRALWRALALAGARIATVSEFSRERIAACIGISPSRIAVMREGYDHIHRVAADQSILAKNRLRPGRFALVVGSKVPHKNLQVLASLEPVLRQHDVDLAVVGSIDTKVFQSSDDGFGARAKMLGRINDSELRALYETAACLLFPTRYEGFGLPAVEAMACGCPVLTSGAGAVREVCGDAALYFDVAGPHSLGQTLSHFLGEPHIANMLRARGTARSQYFTWDKAALDLSVILQQSWARSIQ